MPRSFLEKIKGLAFMHSKVNEIKSSAHSVANLLTRNICDGTFVKHVVDDVVGEA